MLAYSSTLDGSKQQYDKHILNWNFLNSKQISYDWLSNKSGLYPVNS